MTPDGQRRDQILRRRQVPAGASGSSQRRVKLRVQSAHRSSSREADRFAPSHVKRRGIAAPSAKAVEFSRSQPVLSLWAMSDCTGARLSAEALVDG
jgi:hypothetical protein